MQENKGQWNGEKFFILERTKSGFFDYECRKCGHTWSTKFGTFKIFVAFKKASDGFLMEDEIFVRVIAFKQDCKNCDRFAQSGVLTCKNAIGPEAIGKKYVDMAAFSIGNTILKVLGYLQEPPMHKKPNLSALRQEQHQSNLCGACMFGCCMWVKDS